MCWILKSWMLRFMRVFHSFQIYLCFACFCLQFRFVLLMSHCWNFSRSCFRFFLLVLIILLHCYALFYLCRLHNIPINCCIPKWNDFIVAAFVSTSIQFNVREFSFSAMSVHCAYKSDDRNKFFRKMKIKLAQDMGYIWIKFCILFTLSFAFFVGKSLNCYSLIKYWFNISLFFLLTFFSGMCKYILTHPNENK